MTTETPPDEVLIEAAKQANLSFGNIDILEGEYYKGKAFRALCDLIAKHEKPLVDRKLLCAREAMAECLVTIADFREVDVAVRAIELWEKGFGK
jgi:hypothetical protein